MSLRKLIVGVVIGTVYAAGMGVLPGRAHAGVRQGSGPVSWREVADGASTIDDLEARDLATESLDRDESCPSADANLDVPGVGPVVQVGPVAAALFSEDPQLRLGERVTRADDHPRRGWRRAKVLWLVEAGTPEPVIVRAARIDGRSAVRWLFNGNDQTLDLTGRDAESTAPDEWKDIPSAIVVRKPGCYALQIDGPAFQATIILRARIGG